MILENEIARVIEQQKDRILSRDTGLKREMFPSTRSLSSHALIISGIRRCGKSTLLMQMMKEMPGKTMLYLNFESPRLFDFSLHDFTRLDNIIRAQQPETLFFDEIQLVGGWELFIREKLDEKYRVVITGSNASLLSAELGTKLTGRQITNELFPFSYTEFLTFRALQPSAGNLALYMKTGGFPEYVKNNDDDQLSALLQDVLIRDIVARYGIRDSKSLQRLAAYLFANIGNRVTATRLRQPLSVGATSTVLNWFSHLEQSWLFSFLTLFSHSVKTQLINPRKVYAIDPGLQQVVSGGLSEDRGRILENTVFLHLRRKYRELYYFTGQGECDFIAIRKGTAAELVQTCWELTPDNLDREVSGLLEAMKFFNHKKGLIITFADRDRIKKGSYVIDVIPAFEYLCSSGTNFDTAKV